jgi:AraC-like DNA-binding protein
MLTVKEVAARTDFGDARQLHTAYKAAYGVTPCVSRHIDDSGTVG